MVCAITQLARKMGTSKTIVRRLLVEGFMYSAGSGIEPYVTRIWRVEAGDNLENELNRAYGDFPHLKSMELATEFGDLLRIVLPDRAVRPVERIREVAELLLKERQGQTANLTNGVLSIIGGTQRDTQGVIASVVRREVESPTFGEGIAQAMIAAGGKAENSEIFARLGILYVDGESSTDTSRPCDFDPILAGQIFRQRLSDLASAPFDLQRIRDVHRVREIMGIPMSDDMPEVLLDSLIDWRLSLGQKFAASDIFHEIGGNPLQISNNLRRRKKAGQDVSIPMCRSDIYHWSIEDVRAHVEKPLRSAPKTVLDPKHGHLGMKPGSAAMSAYASIENDQFKKIMDVVALHMFACPTHKSKRLGMHNAMLRNSKAFSRLDPTSSRDVNSVLTALLVVAKADDINKQKLLHDISLWSLMVDVFDSYLNTPDLPNDLVIYLKSIRPAMPMGANQPITDARAATAIVKAKNGEARNKRLNEAFQKFRRMEPALETRRNETRAFRRSVMRAAETAEFWAENTELPPSAISVETTHVIYNESAPLGEQKRTILYKVHRWEYLIDLLGRRVAVHFREYQRKRVNRLSVWEKELFENKYVVEYVACIYENGEEAPPPYWFAFHIDQMFSLSKDLSVEEAKRRALALMRMDRGDLYIGQRPSGLGNFKVHNTNIVRKVRKHFGMILLPVDEHDHLEAFGQYFLTCRLDLPIRPGEQITFNIGENLLSHQAGGQLYDVFQSYRKMQPDLNDFLVSREISRLVEEVLLKTCRRITGKNAIDPVSRPHGGHSRAPDRERYVAAYGDRSLSKAQADVAVTLFLNGDLHMSGKDCKVFWNILARLAGKSLAERATAQGHKDVITTIRHYDPILDEERDDAREIQRRAVETGRAQSPAPDQQSYTNSERQAEITKASIELATVKARIDSSSGAERQELFATYREIQVRLKAAQSK